MEKNNSDMYSKINTLVINEVTHDKIHGFPWKTRISPPSCTTDSFYNIISACIQQN